MGDAVVGGWQTSFNMFAKTGSGFTPFWICDDCFPITPGNIGVTSMDAVGDFNVEPSYRPIVTGNPNHRVGDQIFGSQRLRSADRSARTSSAIPMLRQRNVLQGPGTWGVNLGIHKDFHFGERWTAQIGADINNVFNHPLFSPDS